MALLRLTVALLLFRCAFAASKAAQCDLSVGSWVQSAVKPSYNFNCPYINADVNCAKLQRPDEGYQHWAWQPKNCSLSFFNPRLFLSKMRNKVMLFGGDSNAAYLYQSIRCQLATVARVPDFYGPLVQKNVTGFKAPAYNFIAVLVDAPFLVAATPRKLGADSAKDSWNVPIDIPSAKLQNLMAASDVAILSTGYYYSYSNRLYYDKGRPMVPQPAKGLTALPLVLKNFADFLVKSRIKAIPYFLSFPPSHSADTFQFQDASCAPYVQPFDPSAWGLASHRSISSVWDSVERRALNGTRMRLLDITYLSLGRPDGHVGNYGPKGAVKTDCTKWCLPGVPDAWTDVFYTMLQWDL